MAAESMTSDERLWAAIRLEKPDRVPVLPTLLPEPAAHLTGRSLAEIASDSQQAVEAVFEVFDEYGGWENPYPVSYTPVHLQVLGVQPLKMQIPGRELPDDYAFQIDEQEILRVEDYDTIAEGGLEAFYRDDYLQRISAFQPEELPGIWVSLLEGFERFMAACAQRGTGPFFIGHGLHPFFALSLMRSLVPFTRDLYENPAPVERALRTMTTELIDKQLSIIKGSGINLWLMAEERACGFFYPPAIFERFWWPYTRQIVEALWSEGIVTVFHLDQCWDRNLQYFRQLPRGSAIVELDSTTDIFAAKTLLRDHLCLKGDVSAALLTIGQPDEVAAYCRRLIDEVGSDGGFILGSGCSVPPNVKAENLRAMIETGKTHELSKA